MDDDSSSIEAPAVFLDGLGERLAAKEGIDVALANILRAYLLTAEPAPNAVAQTKQAILKLAASRVNPSKPAAING